MIGQTLGHYRITGKLGAGGMGVVYRARDTSLDRDVALKLLPTGAQQSAEARARLVEEARTASALNHPHICTIHEVGESAGVTFAAMELVEGSPLAAQVPADGLPVELILRYGAQIADALAHAHERGIIHRDLKSANVMITPDGRAKVLDFGLARRLSGSELEEATRSKVATAESAGMAGTLHYMAPEIFRNQPADPRSDIWALGVVLYEMASGRLPYDATTAYELTSAILRDPLPPLPARIPAGLRAVIQRCLAREPGQRYQRAGEVRAALETIGSSDATLPAVALPIAPSLRPWWRRAAVLWTALLVAVSGIAIWKGPLILSIGVTKTGPGGPRTSTGGPASPNREANDFFEKAVFLLRPQIETMRARRMLEHALELDPRFAEARAFHGFTYILELGEGYSNDGSILYKAEAELRRALQEDSNLAYGYAFLGALYLHLGRKELAREMLDKARQMDPGQLGATQWLAMYHLRSGNNDAAKTLIRANMESHPLFLAARTSWSDILVQEGRFAEARAEAEKIFEQAPANPSTLRTLAWIYLGVGDLTRAHQVLENAGPEARRNFRVRLVRALLSAREGRREDALRELDAELLKYAEANVFSTYAAAACFALLDQKEKALDWLERAVRGGDERAEWFQRDPFLASIRSQPQFKQIMESIHFRRQQRLKTKNG